MIYSNVLKEIGKLLVCLMVASPFVSLFIELYKGKKVNRLINKDIKKIIKKFPKADYPKKKWLIPLICVLAGSDILTIIYASILMHFHPNLTFFEALFTKFTLYVSLVPLIIYAICIFISIRNNNLYSVSNISEFIKKYLQMNVESAEKTGKVNHISLKQMYKEEYVKINIDFYKYVVLELKARVRSPDGVPIMSFSLGVITVFEHEMPTEFLGKLINTLEKIPYAKVSYSKNQIICTVQPNSAKNNIYYMYLILQTIDKFLQLEF